MTEFTKKSPEIERLMEDVSKAAGGSGRRTSGKCPTCAREFDPDAEFVDDLSRREYRISGMCQECQDSVFNQDEDDEDYDDETDNVAF